MNTINETNFHFPKQKSVYKGKVREVYNINDEVFELITNIEESADEDKEMIEKHKKELEDKKTEYIKKDKELEEKLDNELEEKLDNE